MIASLLLCLPPCVLAGDHAVLHPADATVYLELPDIPAAIAAYPNAPLLSLLADAEVSAAVAGLGLVEEPEGFDLLHAVGAAIDERIAPEEGEMLIVKKRASAFHGTYLAGYLRAQRVDTVILTGVTMAGCVRHSTEDAIAEGFRPIVVREGVGDRVPGVVEWNLFDIDAKFGDVEPLDNVLGYLDGIEAFANR